MNAQNGKNLISKNDVDFSGFDCLFFQKNKQIDKFIYDDARRAQREKLKNAVKKNWNKWMKLNVLRIRKLV